MFSLIHRCLITHDLRTWRTWGLRERGYLEDVGAEREERAGMPVLFPHLDHSRLGYLVG